MQEHICIWILFTLAEESSQRRTGNSLMHGIKSDPVDEWECERARRIEKIQGNSNDVVMRDCKN